jgi:hypothetical protein
MRRSAKNRLAKKQLAKKRSAKGRKPAGSEDFAEVFGGTRREGALVLVRPDGYVAFRAPASERGRLDAWMNRWMRRSEMRSAAA